MPTADRPEPIRVDQLFATAVHRGDVRRERQEEDAQIDPPSPRTEPVLDPIVVKSTLNPFAKPFIPTKKLNPNSKVFVPSIQ